jgi:hypothetical protein
MSTRDKEKKEEQLPAFFVDLSDENVDVKVEPKAANDDFKKQLDKKLDDGESKEPPPQKNVGWDTK